MQVGRIKLFCLIKDTDTVRCSLMHDLVESKIIEDYHCQRMADWDHWYCYYYPLQADAEERLEAAGAILVPHFADPEPIGDKASHFHPAAGILPAHTGFQVAKKMATHLGLPIFKPSHY